MGYALLMLRKLAAGIRSYKAFKTDPEKYVKQSRK